MEKNVVMKLVEAIQTKEPQTESTEIQGKTMSEKLQNLVEAIKTIDKEQKNK